MLTLNAHTTTPLPSLQKIDAVFLCGSWIRIRMSPGRDPDVFMTTVYQLRDQLIYMGEATPDERPTDFVIKSLADDYKQIKYNAERALK